MNRWAATNVVAPIANDRHRARCVRKSEMSRLFIGKNLKLILFDFFKINDSLISKFGQRNHDNFEIKLNNII